MVGYVRTSPTAQSNTPGNSKQPLDPRGLCSCEPGSLPEPWRAYVDNCVLRLGPTTALRDEPRSKRI